MASPILNFAEAEAKIDQFIAENEDALVADIAALVAVPSVEGPAAKGAPFGAGPRQALDAALAIAKRLGLATQDGAGYVGWAELPGRQPGVLATIAHLDVVPAADGWTGDAFTLRRRDGWLIGRGVQDDKGPAVLCLYALKCLAALQGTPRYTLRALLGGNEETGMADVQHYLGAEGQPLFCFSPDANFPVCNGEKGVFEGNFVSGPLAGGDFLEFEGGVASNVIPDKATCLLRGRPALPAEAGITLAVEGENTRITATGVGGHAASPERSRNAIGILVAYLRAGMLGSPAEQGFLALLAALHSATDGSGLGIACSDGRFTPLTCIGGTIRLENGRLTQNVNIRYPGCTSAGQLVETLNRRATARGAAFTDVFDAPPFYIPADSPAIQTLLNTWNEVSGRQDAPFTMGGGTYARHFAHAVSYGPADTTEPRPAFAGHEHMADEAVSLASLRQALKVYTLALLRLQEIDF
uniref:Putative dipeptidase n=1 Tax=termite gut metagenome TaxID=433724 RepID=S0DFU8_9ZZZZ